MGCNQAGIPMAISPGYDRKWLLAARPLPKQRLPAAVCPSEEDESFLA